MSETRESPALSTTTDLPAIEPTVPAVAPEPAAVPATAPPAPPTTPTPEPPGPIAARFGQLAAQRREAEARAERLEKLVTEQGEQLRQALSALKPPAPMPPAPMPPAPVPSSDDTPRPVRETFSDQESYEAALVSWGGERAAAVATAKLQRAQEEAEAARVEQARAAEEARVQEANATREAENARTMQTAWEARLAKAIEANPDLDFEKISQSSLPVSEPMAYVIVSQEGGPELAYFLSKNPEEAARVAAISVPGQVFPQGHPRVGLPVPNAIAQAFELGKLAGAKLGGATMAASAPPTTPTGPPPPVVLPAPPVPLSGASAAATRKSADEMTMDEYAAHRGPRYGRDTAGRVH